MIIWLHIYLTKNNHNKDKHEYVALQMARPVSTLSICLTWSCLLHDLTLLVRAMLPCGGLNCESTEAAGEVLVLEVHLSRNPSKIRTMRVKRKKWFSGQNVASPSAVPWKMLFMTPKLNWMFCRFFSPFCICQVSQSQPMHAVVIPIFSQTFWRNVFDIFGRALGVNFTQPDKFSHQKICIF